MNRVLYLTSAGSTYKYTVVFIISRRVIQVKRRNGSSQNTKYSATIMEKI